MRLRNPHIIVAKASWFLRLFNSQYRIYFLHSRDVVFGCIRMSEPEYIKSYTCKNKEIVEEKISNIRNDYSSYKIDVVDVTGSERVIHEAD